MQMCPCQDIRFRGDDAGHTVIASFHKSVLHHFRNLDRFFARSELAVTLVCLSWCCHLFRLDRCLPFNCTHFDLIFLRLSAHNSLIISSIMVFSKLSGISCFGHNPLSAVLVAQSIDSFVIHFCSSTRTLFLIDFPLYPLCCSSRLINITYSMNRLGFATAHTLSVRSFPVMMGR